MASVSSVKSYHDKLEIFFRYISTKLFRFEFEIASDERASYIKPISFKRYSEGELKSVGLDYERKPSLDDLKLERTDMWSGIKKTEYIPDLFFRIYYVYDVTRCRIQLDHVQVPFILYHNGNPQSIQAHESMITSFWLNRDSHRELYGMMTIPQEEVLSISYEMEERIEKMEVEMAEINTNTSRLNEIQIRQDEMMINQEQLKLEIEGIKRNQEEMKIEIQRNQEEMKIEMQRNKNELKQFMEETIAKHSNDKKYLR